VRVGWWVGRAGSCKPGRYCAKGFAMAPAFWSQHSQSMKPFAGLRCDNRAIAVTESKYIGCSVIEWLGGHEFEMMIRDGGENDPCLPVWKVWNSSGTSWLPTPSLIRSHNTTSQSLMTSMILCGPSLHFAFLSIFTFPRR